MDLTYFSLDALLSSTDPLHRRRAELITSLTTPTPLGCLEPMTIIFNRYHGVGDISYAFPNESYTRPRNVSADGFMHSNWHGKKSWIFFQPALKFLETLKDNGTPVIVLLCARTTPPETGKKDLYPLVVVKTQVGGGRFISAEAARMSKDPDEFLFWCYQKNQAWLKNYTIEGSDDEH